VFLICRGFFLYQLVAGFLGCWLEFWMLDVLVALLVGLV